jgi:hypothetical protein
MGFVYSVIITIFVECKNNRVMKAKLEFDLNDIENDERSNFEDAINGTKWRLAMWELDQWLRKQYKYMSDEEYSQDKYETYEKCREKLRDILIEDGLNLE